MTTKHLFLAGLSTALLAFGGCKRERERTPEARDRVADHDRATTRDDFVRSTHEAIDSLNARIDELEAKADVESRDAAAKLRVRRDELAMRLDHAGDVADDKWDEFRSDVEHGLSDLRDDLDKRF